LPAFLNFVCTSLRATDLAILNQNATFNYLNETNYLLLRAEGGRVKNLRVAVIEFKTEDGQYLPIDSIEQVDNLVDMAANSIQRIGFRLNAQRFQRPGTYVATVSVVGETETATGQPNR
jgi:hypothetical protein